LRWSGGKPHKPPGGGCNTPPFGFPAYDGKLWIFYGNGSTDCPVDQSHEVLTPAVSGLKNDTWYRIMVYVDFEDDATGQIRLYMDTNDGRGMKLRYTATNINTLYSNKLPSFDTIGALCDGCGSHPYEDLYVADTTVATTRAGAETAFGRHGWEAVLS